MAITSTSFDKQQDRDFVEDSAAVAGAGGGDMSVWSESDTIQRVRLLVGDVQDQSSFGVPGGVAGDYRWGKNIDDTGEQAHVADGDSITGGGGGSMPIWKRGRITKLLQLGTGDVTNNASFTIPNGVVGGSGWNKNIDAPGEKLHGVNGTGVVLEADDSPMSGTVQLEVDGDVRQSQDVVGDFTLTGTAPDGAEQGADVPGRGFDLRFDINIQGIDVLRQSIGNSIDIGTVKYGRIDGRVTNFNGEPVPNASLNAPGAGTSTDQQGYYEFNAPGGAKVTLSGLEGAVEKSRTPSAGGVLTVDWQFSGVLAKAQLPDGTSIPNAPIEVSSSEGKKRTDDGGEFQFVRVPPSDDVTITYLEAFSETITSSGEGDQYEAAFEFGAGCKGFVQSERGNEIEAVDIIFDIEGVPVTFTRNDGQFAIGVVDPGDLTLVCALNDRRYNRVDQYLSLSEGEVEERDFTLPDATNLGNIA